jgi:hypothetical protein
MRITGGVRQGRGEKEEEDKEVQGDDKDRGKNIQV